jgi:hypothetical protein
MGQLRVAMNILLEARPDVAERAAHEALFGEYSRSKLKLKKLRKGEYMIYLKDDPLDKGYSSWIGAVRQVSARKWKIENTANEVVGTTRSLKHALQELWFYHVEMTEPRRH